MNEIKWTLGISIRITFPRKCVDGHKVDQIVGISIEQSSLMSPFLDIIKWSSRFIENFYSKKWEKFCWQESFQFSKAEGVSYFYISKSNCWQFKNQFRLMRSCIKVIFCTQQKVIFRSRAHCAGKWLVALETLLISQGLKR